jgi:hypothetical protein
MVNPNAKMANQLGDLTIRVAINSVNVIAHESALRESLVIFTPIHDDLLIEKPVANF